MGKIQNKKRLSEEICERWQQLFCIWRYYHLITFLLIFVLAVDRKIKFKKMKHLVFTKVKQNWFNTSCCKNIYQQNINCQTEGVMSWFSLFLHFPAVCVCVLIQSELVHSVHKGLTTIGLSVYPVFLETWSTDPQLNCEVTLRLNCVPADLWLKLRSWELNSWDNDSKKFIKRVIH